MGEYINPPTMVKNGRIILEGTFEHMKMMLRPGEILVGLYDNLSFKLAPVIYNKEELEEFERQYREGWFVTHKFYAIPDEWRTEKHGKEE